VLVIDSVDGRKRRVDDGRAGKVPSGLLFPAQDPASHFEAAGILIDPA